MTKVKQKEEKIESESKGCNCLEEISKKIVEKEKPEPTTMVLASFLELLLMQGTLYNTVEVSICRGGKKPKKKKILVVHSYCPFCGIKLKE